MTGMVRLSYLTDADLDAIRDYITQHNPAAANRILDEIFATLETLASRPLLGQKRDDIQTSLRIFTVRDHVIFYSPSADGIHVTRILYGTRDFPALFPVELEQSGE